MKLVETAQERNAAFALRLRVSSTSRASRPDEELDGQDESATHAVALLGGDIVGTGRVLYLDSAEARIDAWPWTGRGAERASVAVYWRPWSRLQGDGGSARLPCTPRPYVIAFYSSLGYVEEGWVSWRRASSTCR